MKDNSFWHRLVCSRLWVALGTALLVLLGAPHAWPGVLRALTAWNVAVFFFLAMAWRVILSCDAKRTRALSRQQDENRSIIDSVLLSASFVSLGGVLMALVRAKDASELGLTVSAITTVVLSWALIHTIYAFHYARLYYEGAGAGGINFHGDEPPDYLDFCYFSFAVGTTFGATDSEIGGREIRRTILKHGVLSFGFATVILALAISVVSNLLPRA